MLAALEQRVAALPTPSDPGQLTTHLHDATELSTAFPASPPALGLSHILGTFSLQYMPDPMLVLQQARDALREDGVLGVGIFGPRNGPVDAWSAASAEASRGQFEAGQPHEEGAWLRPEQVRETLQGAGFRDVRIETGRFNLGFGSVEDVMRFWYIGENPVATRLQRIVVLGARGRFCEVEGLLETLKACHRGVLERDYGGGKEVAVEYVLGVGRK